VKAFEAVVLCLTYRVSLSLGDGAGLIGGGIDMGLSGRVGISVGLSCGGIRFFDNINPSFLLAFERVAVASTDGSVKPIREGAAHLPLETGISYRRGVLELWGD
jgi:hypothetical protein